MTDDEFLQKLFEDGWTETYNPNPQDWVPQGEPAPYERKTMTEQELDATRPYTYNDYDGESLTLRQQKRKWDHGSFVTVEYKGEGPVFLSSTDDVLRTALALIIRGADPDLPYVSTVVHGLRAAIKDIDDERQYKRGQTVEVYDRHKEFGSRVDWCKGEVMGYYDSGEYAILPEGFGVYISYHEDDIRERQEEN